MQTLFPVPTPRRDRPADGMRASELMAVRAWARSRGYPIDETSRVPLAVLRTYRDVHAG